MDKQREKLVELIYDDVGGVTKVVAEAIADHLLANGVIVPPCKAGDKVYQIVAAFGYVRECEVVGFHLGDFPTLRGTKRPEYLVCYGDHSLYHLNVEHIGKTVFLSREDAEKALEV